MNTEFPYETIDLPSKGIFYPEESPLRNGTIDIAYMTAKHEDILTSTNLIQKGTVLDKLFESLIVTKGVSPRDLLLGDLNAVMIASRILGYGREYPISTPCIFCGTRCNVTVDLSTLEDKTPKRTPDADGLFPLTLPSGKNIRFGLLTRKDELDMAKEIESLRKTSGGIEREWTTRLRHIVREVDGESSSTTIYNFVETMLVRDSKILREAFQEASPDVDFTVPFTCDCTPDTSQEVRLPIGSDFFWPNR